MSNKNISQSITEAWAKSVATGMVQSEKKEQKRQQLEETSATLHNKAVQHILENDKGFYRPDTDPFFRKGDGDLLRRQRLDEQTPGIGAAVGAARAVKAKEEEEEKRVDSEMEAIRKREQEEIARRDAQAQTGINPDSERYRGRENEAALRGDPDFDPAAPGAAGEARASQVKDNLGKVRRVFRDGRRLPAGYGGRGTNYGGAVAVGQMAPRELSPEERERQRAEQEERMRSGAEERLKGLDPERRARIEAGLADDADLDTITTAITRERGGQDRASKLADAGYESGTDFDPQTGKMTAAGQAKRDAKLDAAEARRDVVRARSQNRADRNRADNRASEIRRIERANIRRANLGMKPLAVPPPLKKPDRLTRAASPLDPAQGAGAGGGADGGAGGNGELDPKEVKTGRSGLTQQDYEESPAGQAGREEDPAYRPIGGGEPTVVSNVMGALENAGSSLSELLKKPREIQKQILGELGFDPEGILSKIAAVNPVTGIPQLIGMAGDALGDLLTPDAPEFGNYDPEELARDSEAIQRGDQRTGAGDAGQASRIRAGQGELQRAGQDKPEVPAGVYPFEDPAYLKWFGTLGAEAQMAETRRVENEERQRNRASAPDQSAAPPPTVESYKPITTENLIETIRKSRKKLR